MNANEAREFDYELVRKCVYKFLWKSHHERHYDDCVQYCSLMWFEGRTNIEWTVIKYCRINGIGERGKQSAKTLEYATLVGLANDENENTKEMGFLFDHNSVVKHIEDENEKDSLVTFDGALEEFLAPFNIKEGALKWAIRTYQLYKTSGKTYSTSQTRSMLARR